MKLETKNITDENIKKILELFPNVATEALSEDGKLKTAIDFEKLKQELSEVVIDGEESYDFTWVGKKEAIIEANRPIRKTLRPDRESSVDWKNTQNIYIEGDNLDALKLLQESYLGKIKMIYIDPPYNTGKDFVYRDNFTQDKESYYEELGLKDEDENRLFQNTESNGRFHSDWCSMIYSRLKLARNLLSDDGVIFISIDDNEVRNLKNICDEVFGEISFISVIPILSNPRGRQSSAFIAETHEYVLIYSKNSNECIINGFDLTEEQKKEYNLSDKNGQYRLLGLRLRGGRATAVESPTLHFPIYYSKEYNDFYLTRQHDNDYEIIPKFEDGTLGTWRWSKDKISKNKDLLIVKPVKDRYDVFQKDYLSADKKMKAKSLWDEKEINYDRSANELKELFNNKIFDYAKPLYLSDKILKLGTTSNDIILDFFSGCATTAHACMQLNAEDGGNRKFIMVQLPEKTDEKSEAFKAGYKNICEIGEERIRRAGKKIQEENPDKKIDIGFRVFKIDDTNMKDVYYTPSELKQGQLNYLETNIKDDRTDEDLLYGCLLDWGVELSLPHKVEIIDGKRVHIVDEDTLIACFEEDIPESVIRKIADMKPLRVVFRDSSFISDDNKINIEEIFKLITPDTRVKVI